MVGAGDPGRPSGAAQRDLGSFRAASAGKTGLPSLAKQLRAPGFAESSVSGRPQGSAGLLLGGQGGPAIPRCSGRGWL